jgi:NTE family protein
MWKRTGSSILLLVLLAAASATADFDAAGASTAPCEGTRALILGGGGVTGYAWEIGLLKGLADEDINLPQADLIVGTSAGAIAAAQLAAEIPVETLYAEVFDPPPGSRPPASPEVDLSYLLDTFAIWQDADPSIDDRIEVGRRALAMVDAVGEDELISFVHRAFHITEWPTRPLKISATDVVDGSSWLFDRSQNVPIDRAIAASIALPLIDAPVTVGDRRYMDGGVSGSTHFDAASGYECVVGITPGGGALAERQIQHLEDAETRVLRITPDTDSAEARGLNPSDQSRRAASAEAGLRQAQKVAPMLRTFWARR